MSAKNDAKSYLNFKLCYGIIGMASPDPSFFNETLILISQKAKDIAGMVVAKKCGNLLRAQKSLPLPKYEFSIYLLVIIFLILGGFALQHCQKWGCIKNGCIIHVVLAAS